MKADPPSVLKGMQGYYTQRAPYYERVYHKAERQADLRAMAAWLPGLFEGRHVLEVACGTGWWTPHGARDAASWLATDLSPETMAVAQAKPMPACVRFATVDAYSWEGLPPADGLPGQRFNAAFAGCWWSHVPLQGLPQWLASLGTHLAPGARVVFLDNRYVQTSNLPITHSDAAGNTYQTRTLDDGSVHEVLKNFPTAASALAALGPHVQHAQWLQWEHYWALDCVWAGRDGT